MNKILITVLGLLFTNCLVGQNSTYDKLQGKWISKEDKLYSIEFKDGYFIEKSGNNIIEEGKLILSQDCTDENNINVGENYPQNGSITKLKVTENDIEIEEYNKID